MAPPGTQLLGQGTGQVLANAIAVTLGNISFLNFECPNEKVDHFGGTQAIVRHKFPGGYITTETFGGFPPDSIKWEGQFFQDATLPGDMYDRIDALQQMRVAGVPVTLTVGRFSYQVILHRINFNFKLQFWIPYEIELIPVADLNSSAIPSASGTASGQPGGSSVTGTIVNTPSNPNQPITFNPPFPDSVTVKAPIPGGNAANGIPPSPINPTLTGSAATEQISSLSNSNFQLSAYLKNLAVFPNVPPNVQNDLTVFQQNLTNAIQQAQNANAGVNSAALAASLEQAKIDTLTLQGGADAGNAAFGASTFPILAGIDNTLTSLPSNQTLLSGAVNPNLNDLALQYLGSPTLWQQIADANKPVYGLLSANPIGTFNLIIPGKQ